MSKFVKVFATENCHRCRQVEKSLEKMGVEFSVADMASVTSRVELSTASTKLWPFGLAGVLEAPIIMIGSEYYIGDNLFNRGFLSYVLNCNTEDKSLCKT